MRKVFCLGILEVLVTLRFAESGDGVGKETCFAANDQ